MAFELKQSGTPQPEQTLVTSYSVHRQGRYPLVIITYAEVARDLSISTSAVVGVDLDEDGIYEALSLADWAAAEGETSPLIGRVLYNSTTRQPLGTILSVQGDIFTLSDALATVPEHVSVQALSVTGSLAWTSVPSGNRWEIHLPMDVPEVASYVENLLGGVMFASAKAVITEMELPVSDGEIMGAVLSLAAKGINEDSFLSAQGEKVEKDRRLGGLPVAVKIVGTAP